MVSFLVDSVNERLKLCEEKRDGRTTDMRLNSVFCSGFMFMWEECMQCKGV